MEEQHKRQSATMTTQPELDTTIDWMELIYALLSGWKMIVCYALILALLAGIYTMFFVVPMYQATSTIYVLSRRDSAINMSDLQIGTALTSDYIKVFQLWEVHEAVISQLNLPYTYRQMANMLSVVNTPDTRMLDITVTSTSPEEAAAIANEYAEVASQYIADTMSTDKPSTMSRALVPVNPISPNKVRSMMLGFLLGGMIAMILITIRMLWNDTYKSTEEVRRYTGLATLAVIPVEGKAEER